MTAHSFHSSLTEPTLNDAVDGECETKENHELSRPIFLADEPAGEEAANSIKLSELDGELLAYLQVLGSFLLAMNSW